MIWLSGFLALFSLLAVMPAPTDLLWMAAIGMTEWGHFLALGAGGLAGWAWIRQGSKTPAVWLALAAALLFISPTVRALSVARGLPAALSQHFGAAIPPTYTGQSPRKAPLSLVQLFTGNRLPGIDETTRVYATYPNTALEMTLYRPRSKDRSLRPCVVMVHGGSWQTGTRFELAALSRYLASRGYSVASVDYRLAPEFKFPAQRHDVLAAVRYLKDQAGELGLDAQRIVLLGRSAGGQVALAAAYVQQDPAIKGVIAIYAPIDLVWGYLHPANPWVIDSKKILEGYLGGSLAQKAAQYEAASPHLSVSETTPPTLMIHGGRDELVSPLHNDRLSEKLSAMKRPYYYLRLPWATHGCDANFNGPCGQLTTYAVERFLAAVAS